MELKLMNISDLKPADYNPRQITTEELDRLKESIRKFGYIEPIIINKTTNNVVGGHQRLKALKDLGYKEVQVIEVSVGEAEERALNLALNKISGEWNNTKLIEVLKSIQTLDEDQLTSTGFTDTEILYLLELERKENERINAMEDDFILGGDVTRIKDGDLIRLGDHLVLCGDSTDPANWRKLLGEEQVDLIATEPPLIKPKPGKFVNVKKQVWDYMKFLSKSLDNANTYLRKGRFLCVNMGQPRHTVNLPAKLDILMEEIGYTYQTSIQWVKQTEKLSIRNPFPRYYKPKVLNEELMIYTDQVPEQSEALVVYEKRSTETRKSGEPIPEIMLSQFAGNVWNIRDRSKTTPTQLMFNVTRFYAFENEIVMDPFIGYGATLLACQQTKRTCRGIELDPEGVQVLVNRFKSLYPDQEVKCVNRELKL